MTQRKILTSSLLATIILIGCRGNARSRDDGHTQVGRRSHHDPTAQEKRSAAGAHAAATGSKSVSGSMSASSKNSEPGPASNRLDSTDTGTPPPGSHGTNPQSRPDDRHGNPDIMDLALVPVSAPPPPGADSVSYIVDTHSKAVIPSDTYQKVTKLGPHRYLVTVRRPNYRHLPHARLGAVSSKGKWAEFLRATSSLQIHNPLLRTLAHKAVAGHRDAAKAAMALTWFTYRYIVHKGYSLPAATALDVARLKRGDCTEHAFLLAALGRAAGLPSRVASGLIFTPTFSGHRNVFVYHMWTEFLIGGTWIPFDGTRPEPGVAPTHILIATDSLSAMFPMAASTALLQALGKIQITVRTKP
ncbi:MAG: transglutaminase domain-containing protein [Deltaproteobacteria bacterium]|nr:transglutaminase domain-containing protein [Deltaproteobacteria bacterium]